MVLVTSVAFSPDGNTLAYASDSGNAITLVEAATGKEIGTLAKAKEGKQMTSVVFSNDGTKLYSQIPRSLEKPAWSDGVGRCQP